jgi:hypothetical protein
MEVFYQIKDEPEYFFERIVNYSVGSKNDGFNTKFINKKISFI